MKPADANSRIHFNFYKENNILLLYCYIISLISKNESINLIQNADLTKKGKTLQNMGTYYYI